jgi:hypothetical protein
VGGAESDMRLVGGRGGVAKAGGHRSSGPGEGISEGSKGACSFTPISFTPPLTCKVGQSASLCRLVDVVHNVDSKCEEAVYRHFSASAQSIG